MVVGIYYFTFDLLLGLTLHILNIASSPDSTITFDIGFVQEIPSDFEDDPFAIQAFLEIISETAIYMENFLTTSIEDDDEELLSLRYDCKNRDSYCAALAAEGYCEEDELDDENWHNYMMNNCAPACQTCENLAYEFELLKCTVDRETDIFQPNELDDMFLRLVGELPFDDDVIVPQFTPRIYSRPSSLSTEVRDSGANADHITDGPWIVTLDDFLTDEECDRLIELGAVEGYERSYLAEDENYDEEQIKREYETDDAWRTSTNSWCQNECYEDPVAQRVIGKIANTTGVPDAYSEYLQLLKYGEFIYVAHVRQATKYDSFALIFENNISIIFVLPARTSNAFVYLHCSSWTVLQSPSRFSRKL